ncbi:MAG TPA: hypothetical protein VGI39_42090 [Polyangiaceae bacterium]
MSRNRWMLVGGAAFVLACAACAGCATGANPEYGPDEAGTGEGSDGAAGTTDATGGGVDAPLPPGDDSSITPPPGDDDGAADAAPGDDSSVPGDDGSSGDDGAAEAAPGDDGGSVDAEPDSAPIVDAGTDTAPPFDAGPDSGTTFDAGHDAGSGLDSGVDAGHDAGFDAGVDSGVDAGHDAGTTISDAGCSPISTTFTPTYYPGATSPLACTTTQVNNFYAACLGSNATKGTCGTWATANATCDSCLEGNTNPAGPKWGPYTQWPLDYNATVLELDIGQCLIADGQSTSCAKAFEALTECEHAACGNACYNHSFENYQACAQDADSNACLTQYNAVWVNASPCPNSIFGTTCVTALVTSGSTFQTAFGNVAQVMCE